MQSKFFDLTVLNHKIGKFIYTLNRPEKINYNQY